jgi:hypothetical protein
MVKYAKYATINFKYELVLPWNKFLYYLAMFLMIFENNANS